MAKGDVRNEMLSKGVERYGRSAMYKRRLMFKRNKVQVAKKSVEKPTTKEVKFGKSTRTVPLERQSRFYPAEDIKKPLPSRKKPGFNKLRASITPGTVLILLSGPYRGRRVIFLKQLPSGLLLVTGPFKVNGVPIRRVNQSYVIATSTKVDISGVSVPEKIDDAYFKRPAQAKKTGEFFAQEEKAKNVISEERQADQKALDASLLAAVNKVDGLK